MLGIKVEILSKFYSARKQFLFAVLFVTSTAGWWIIFTQPQVKPLQMINSNPSRFSPLDQNPKYSELLKLQSAFIRNAKNVRPGVVSVNELKKIHLNKFSKLFPDKKFSFMKFKHWLMGSLERRYVIKTIGSGIILDSSGHILTSHKGIKGIDNLIIRLAGKQEFRARVLGFDLLSDLAVLKIYSLYDFPEIPLGRSSSLEIGEWVMAIGNPYGLEGSVSVGVISGKKGVNGWNYFKYIQTDTSINPGNSGGPLINLDGEVIGINVESDYWGPGMGLTLPIETASQLIENGAKERGWFGIGAQNLDRE